MGECEINCVSYLDERDNKVYTFILRNSNNPLINAFESKVMSGEIGYNYIQNFIKDAVGGNKQFKKYGLESLTYELYFYDSEIELIRDLFKRIHMSSPDFVLGWNSSGFDIEYIIARI